jgi:hypothetical protein
MLIAAGIAPECLLVRDVAQPDWQRGLEATSAVVCDAPTEAELPSGVFPIVFRLFNEATMSDLRRREEALTATPIQ